MAGEEPVILPVGTEVSAKYRGAFCEAKVKKIVKLVKCKVTLSEPRSQIVVLDEDVRGMLKAGAKVEVKHPESGLYVEATLNKLTDCSMYTVVFDDSDENTLRRTQLCLKGEKHFVKSETLDQLPLTHPEHFGTPVMKGYKGTKRRRTPTGAGVSDSESESETSECSSPRKRIYTGRLRDLLGRVLCMEIDDRKKTTWVPVLTIIPSAADMELKTRDHLLVKSFKDSRIHTVARKDTKEFTRDMAIKNEDKALKPAMEKALAYYDSRDLPSNWDREELLGVDSEDEEESDTSDDVPTEEKDHFVAQLYKFMDDRDTPINKPPAIGAHDLNLYRLFMLVRNLGGYNKVTNLMKWKMVYSKMNLPPSTNAYNQIKTAYKKFLHAYEDFYRKLGSTMGNRPGRTRHSSGRSLLSFREREGGQPKSPRAEKKKEEKMEEEKEEEKTGEDKKEEDKVKVKEPEKKESEGKGRRTDERKSTVKEELDLDVDSPRKRRSRNAPGEKKPEEKGDEKTNKRVTREDAAKMKDEPKVKEDVERTRRSTSKKVEEAEDTKEDPAQKRRSVPLRKKGIKVEEKEDVKKKPQEEDISDGGPDEDSDDGEDDDDDEPPPPPPPEPKKGRMKELSLGTKLKVRYGRGRNQKIYEAKVVEAEQEGGSTHYLVHYAGWNNRYDEWVQRDRIVAVVSEGTESDKRLIAAKKLILPKSGVIKKIKRPPSGPSPSPSPNTSKTEVKTPKPKLPTATPTPTPTSSKARPTRSSGPELPTPILPTRRSRRGSGVGDNASDLTSHMSDSDSDDDESGTDDKRMDTDDTDSLKMRSDKSETKSRSQTRTKTMKKGKDMSDSESDGSEPTPAKSKGKYDTKGQGQSRIKAEVKKETDEERSDEEESTEVDTPKKPAGKSTPTRPAKSTVKVEEAAPSPSTSAAGVVGEEAMELGGMEKKANQLLAKEEDAQSEDDILKDLKDNHHIDMGDILVYPDSDMSIAPPKPKTSKDLRGKRRKSTDSMDEVSRQDSLDTVAYGYDIQDAVQNILDQLDDGDDDSDDLPFLTQNKEQKLFPVDGEKKEETKQDKMKKDKKVDKEKAKDKIVEKPKTKAVKKVDKPTAEEVKQESDTEKEKKPTEAEKKKKTKKKKVKKKPEGKEAEKEGEVSLLMTSEKEATSAKVELVSATAACSPTPRGVAMEDVISPPQLAAVTPNKDKDQLSKTDLARLELNVQPPKLQAERLDPPKAEPKPGDTQQTTAIQGLVPPAIIPTLTTAIITATATATATKPSPLTQSPPPKLQTMSQPSPQPSSTVSSLAPSSTPTPITPSSSTLPKVQPQPTVGPAPSSSSSPAQPCTSSATVATSSPTSTTTTSMPVNPAPAPTAAAAAVVLPPTSTPPASPTHHQQPLTTLFDNTPPETPEGSPAPAPPPSDETKSPCHTEESATTAALPSSSTTTLPVIAQPTKTDSSSDPSAALLLLGGESPNACDTSTISNGSEGSSGNMPSSEDSTEGSSLMAHATATKRKTAEDNQQQPAKKRKRGSKRSANVDKGKSTPKHTMSDSDEGPEVGSTSPKGSSEPHTLTPSKGPTHTLTPSKGPTHTLTPSKGPTHALTPSKGTPHTLTVSKGPTHAPTPSKAIPSKGKTPVPGPSPTAPGSSGSSPSRDEPRPPRPSKYNFNLEEGNYLEGDQRIFFIMEKLQDIRKIYMSLKAEVACIDRRRKRAKRREKEGTAMALASLANS